MIDPSLPHGDARCPACGTLLWFVHMPEDLWLFDRRRIDSAKAERLAELLADEEPDSLAIVELMMELEELE